MARKEKEVKAVDTGAWMNTFADLLSLLLTFFVLLFAMKSVDKGKLEEALGFFRQGGMGVLMPGSLMPLSTPDNMAIPPRVREFFTPDEVHRAFTSDRLYGKVDVRTTENGTVISISSKLLFLSGQAELRPESGEMIDEIVLFTQGARYEIQVEGHTDNISISTPKYPTNWDLSIARAGSVVRHMLKDGKLDPKRFSVVGYSDRKPLVPNDTPENRAKNRRVDIVFLN